jgi:hypothetical protein
MSFREGDYVAVRGIDCEAERDDVTRLLKQNGCRSIRFDTLVDGRLQAHGYLRQQECENCRRPAERFVGKWCVECNEHLS